MNDEYQALLKNKTCHLVLLHHARNIVDCKWVYKVKRKQDGSIDRYKSTPGGKGFKQRFCIDYSDTFSTVIKASTIQIVVSLAVSRGWCLQ
jgi:hypothetical protein